MNQMREEFLALKKFKNVITAPAQDVIKDQFVPGTLEHVLFDYEPELLNIIDKQVKYPESCGYRFISFSGAGVKTTFHCFRSASKCQYSYSDGDGLVLLPSALSDCTPARFVEARVVLPRMSHMQIKFNSEVFERIYDFVNE